jgi:hypothetical protein
MQLQYTDIIFAMIRYIICYDKDAEKKWGIIFKIFVMDIKYLYLQTSHRVR